MDSSSQFMVFSIDDVQIQCIEMVQQSLMIISTQRQIMLYDLCTSTALATCPHQATQCQYKQQHNNTNDNSLQQKQDLTEITQQHQAVIEMHYLSTPISSVNQQTRIYKSNANNYRSITMGRLIVHYKMKGISVYDVNKIFTTKNDFAQQVINQGNDEQRDNVMLDIVFNNFTPVMFGSAFLKFKFNNLFYQRMQASLDTQQPFKSAFLLSQQIPTNQLQTTLQQIQRYKDYKLITNNLDKSRQFYIFTNQNELYEVKRMKLCQQDGRLVIMERYQLDEESAEFSLGTVTCMVAVEYGEGEEGYQKGRAKSRQLIITMQGGNTFSYQLPLPNQSPLYNPNIQHYLQPTKTLHLQQQLKSLNPTLTPLINSENLDYSVMSIEMLHDGLGLIVVRKLGVWVVDFRQMRVVGKVQGRRSKGNVQVSRGFDVNDNDVEGDNVKDKKRYQFNDARMIKLISSQITTKTTLLNKQTLISSTLILSIKNKLFKLTFSLTISKEFDTNKIYHQSIQINKARFTTIEQINTSLIEDVKMVGIVGLSQEGEDGCEANKKVVQIYGHYKQDKVFHLFL